LKKFSDWNKVSPYLSSTDRSVLRQHYGKSLKIKTKFICYDFLKDQEDQEQDLDQEDQEEEQNWFWGQISAWKTWLADEE